MAIWRIGPVEDMPEVSLRRWSIRETDSGTIHFVGYNVLRRQGRISTAITSFDARTRPEQRKAVGHIVLRVGLASILTVSTFGTLSRNCEVWKAGGT